MHILVTGGAGYIGSHTVIELLNAGHSVAVVDNLVNSSRLAMQRVEKITGRQIPFYETDIRDREGLRKIFAEHSFDCCIHFAGLKAVGESVQKPLEYYDNNISGTCPKGHCTNPYGNTKSMLEEILRDLHVADNEWNVVLLRYFNPIGAHSSGLIGENPNGVPNNLMPYITQVAAGKLKELHVFGNDYPTPDGTGVRDYIHVVDLAKGHVKALKAIDDKCGIEVYNLGTGIGYSVLDLVKAFEKANGIKIPYVIDQRRAGDVAACYSDPSKAWEKLGWKAELGIEDMCRDSWNWQKNNPNGFEA